MSRVRVLADGDALGRVAPALDALHRDLACPVTARRPWMQVWLETYADYRPLVVTVGGHDHEIDAAAVLAVNGRHRVLHVVPVGAGPSDEVRLPARDDGSARLLSEGIAIALEGLQAPWRLAVRHLPADELVLPHVQGPLRWAAVAPGDQTLRLRFHEDRSLRPHVTRNHHQQVRRLSNRMRRDGVCPELAVLRDAAEVEQVLTEVERVCRARDFALRGYSQLDDASAGRFFRTVIRRHAELGEVELVTMRVRGELIAYVLNFLDGDSRRMWNCRFAPDWGDYGPGRLAINEALRVALADPGCTTFDWMLGTEQYKTSMSNTVHDTADLFAYSSPALYAAHESARRVANVLRRAKNRNELLGRSWQGARLLVSRYQRGSR